ncbi:MAG TPA: radical SAM protein [Candidatus Nanoarchaeia archaeon]|nr:hypothetical protein [uncultured archaeon]HLC46530.1 radical SAM protein [Candidatus Nanoarchaeia archaeon]
MKEFVPSMRGIIYNLRRFVFTPNVTPKRLINLVKISYNYALKKSVVNSYPCRLIIDPVNICVLKCPLCPTGKGEKGRTLGSMKLEDFKKIIDEVGDYIYEVDLYNWGESLLNKDIFRMIEYCKARKINVKISSNLNHWQEGFEKKLVSSGLDCLIVSLDGTNQEVYEKYRRGGDFSKVIRNVKAISEAKKAFGSKTPQLVWQFIVMRQNEHQLPIAQKTYSKYGFDTLRIVPVRTDTSKEVFQSDEEKMKSSQEWLPKDEKYSRFDYKSKKKKSQLKSCIFPWTLAAINPNGAVSPCCAVYPEKHDFGNAFTYGFMKVWNNPFYVASRKAIAGKDPGRKIVCENCVKYGFIE